MSTIFKMAMRGRPMFMLKTGYTYSSRLSRTVSMFRGKRKSLSRPSLSPSSPSSQPWFSNFPAGAAGFGWSARHRSMGERETMNVKIANIFGIDGKSFSVSIALSWSNFAEAHFFGPQTLTIWGLSRCFFLTCRNFKTRVTDVVTMIDNGTQKPMNSRK